MIIYPFVSTSGQVFVGLETEEFAIAYYKFDTLPLFFGVATFIFCTHTMVNVIGIIYLYRTLEYI